MRTGSPRLGRRLLVLAFSAACLAACDGGSGATSTDSALPACAWSPTFEAGDAAEGQCQGERGIAVGDGEVRLLVLSQVEDPEAGG